MAIVTAEAPSRPEARVFRVEDLLRHARAGRIRVPPFQRGFKWERDDVHKLIDSIWRGYPIGTLLLWSKTGPAGRVPLGDLTFEVSEQSQAWFVVDGQQRIVSLVSTLMPKGARPDKFDLYFDLVRAEVTHARRGAVPATHLPLNRVVDSEELLAWVDENRLSLTPEWVRLALRVGKLLREYEVPAYVVDVEDERVVREIFERTNSSGRPLEVSEVFHALHIPLDRHPSVSLKDVVGRLRQRSLGEIEEDHVLRSLLAIEGKDQSGDLHRQLADVDVSAAVSRVEKALDRVFGFLSQDAGIPHLRLLPYRSPLAVLSTFFHHYPTPSARARRLLTRWIWRGTAREELRGDRTAIRTALDAVRDAKSDESAAAGVLATVSKVRPVDVPITAFNLRHARPRLLGIAMMEMHPHHLQTGEILDVPALLDTGEDVFPQILTRRQAEDAETALFSSVGNRLLHPAIPGSSLVSLLQSQLPRHVLASHAFTPEMMLELRAGNRLGFLSARRDFVEATATSLIDSRAEWGHSDRPSIPAMSDSED